MTELLDPREVEPSVEDRAPRETAGVRRRRSGSLVVDLHNVLGLLAAIGIIVVSATGIVLNHLPEFGLARQGATAEVRAPLDELRSVAEVVSAGQGAEMAVRGGIGGPADLDRAIWKLDEGTVEVRLKTDPVQSVTVEAATAQPLDRRVRHDLDVTKLHSGEIVGGPWVILSDLVALALVVSIVAGVWVWLRRVRARGALVGARAGTPWIRANWWLHLVGGLGASGYLIVMSVTGVMLNHKQPWGYMQTAPDLPKRSAEFQPISIEAIAQAGIASRGADYGPGDLSSIDYRPKGYGKVRFADDYEVIVDAADGSVEKADRRWDVWIEDLHSGMLFGSKGWLLADVPAAIAILLTVNGAYLWTRPAWRSREGRAAART